MIVDGVILQKTDTARLFGLTTKKYCVVFLFFLFWFNLFNVLHFDEWASCCIYVKAAVKNKISFFKIFLFFPQF